MPSPAQCPETRENFLYGFKGAQARRNPGRELALDQRHAKLRRIERGVPAAGRRGQTMGTSRSGRLVPHLGPSGHGGVGALQAPAPAAQLEVATTQRHQAPRIRLPSPRRSSIEPRKITVKSALRASLAMAQAPLWTLIFPGFVRRFRHAVGV